MSNWLTRPGYIAILAFLAGGALAAAAVLIFTQCGDGDDDANAPRTPALETSTPSSTTPGATIAPPATGTPAATQTPSSALDPDDALANYVREVLEGEYGGPCSAGPPVGSYCSSDLYRGEDLVTFLAGLANSEFFLEAVATRNEDATWSINVFTLPDPAVPLSIGAQAIVHGAGDCLRFHEQPGINTATLTCQLDGTRARVDDGAVQADGVSWWHLEGFGWASAEFLGVAAP